MRWVDRFDLRQRSHRHVPIVAIKGGLNSVQSVVQVLFGKHQAIEQLGAVRGNDHHARGPVEASCLRVISATNSLKRRWYGSRQINVPRSSSYPITVWR